MKLEFSRQIFEKYSGMKFHKNPFNGSRDVLCGRTDMTKLIVASRSLENAPKMAAIWDSLLIIMSVFHEQIIFYIIGDTKCTAHLEGLQTNRKN
jgi:hypothetical protein